MLPEKPLIEAFTVYMIGRGGGGEGECDICAISVCFHTRNNPLPLMHSMLAHFRCHAPHSYPTCWAFASYAVLISLKLGTTSCFV